jgi:hypothetical protein
MLTPSSRLKQRLFAEREYQAGSWELARRAIVKAEHNDKDPTLRFLLTNKVGTPESLYDFYASAVTMRICGGRSKSVPGGGRKT